MSVPQRLPFVNGDDGQWGDILVQWLKKEHYDDGTDNAVNGGHQKVTLRAGTATAGTAPLKFTSGTLLTAAEAGALEFLTDKIYFTITTGPTRKTVAIYDDSSGATGDIYYRDSSGNFVRLGIGNSGDVLKVASGLPAWQAAGYAPSTSGTSILKGNGSGGFSAAVANTDYAPAASPTFTGTVTLPSGQQLTTGVAGASPVTFTDDSASLGKVAILHSFFLVNLQQLAMYGNVSDSKPGLTLTNSSGGQGSLAFGPGGSSGTDVSFARTGTGTATFTGVMTFSSAPVISSITNTGTLTLPTSTDTLVGRATTDTLTNKRITLRSSSTNAPGATPTINTDNIDIAEFTGLGTAITSMTTNLSGTPNRGDSLQIAFTDNGTARAITWGTKFEASTVALPTTTVTNARLDCFFVWNTATSKWRLMWKA